MKSVWFHPEALAEADSAAEYYREKQATLEKRFLLSLQSAVARIRQYPFIYRKITDNVHKSRLRHFPYALVYKVTDTTIEILAVMHIRKQPGYWKNRQIHEEAAAY